MFCKILTIRLTAAIGLLYSNFKCKRNERIESMLYVLLLIAGIVFLIFRMMLPSKEAQKKCREMTGRFYAEGGLCLSENNAPKYSVEALSMASRQGYGLLLPIRLSKDGIPMVLPEASLMSLCGNMITAADSTASEISSLLIRGTEYHPASLREVITSIRSDTRIILDLPAGKSGADIIESVIPFMNDTGCYWAAASYDPDVLSYCRKRYPDIIRIQKTGKCSELKMLPVWKRLPSSLLLSNFIAKPHVLYSDEKNMNRKVFRYCCDKYQAIPAGGLAVDKESSNELKQRVALTVFTGCMPPMEYDFAFSIKKERSQPVTGKKRHGS